MPGSKVEAEMKTLRDAYTAVYSVVNSLLGLGKAQRVQILIEGKGEEWLWGEVSLETSFSLNTEFIDSKE